VPKRKKKNTRSLKSMGIVMEVAYGYLTVRECKVPALVVAIDMPALPIFKNIDRFFMAERFILN